MSKAKKEGGEEVEKVFNSFGRVFGTPEEDMEGLHPEPQAIVEYLKDGSDYKQTSLASMQGILLNMRCLAAVIGGGLGDQTKYYEFRALEDMSLPFLGDETAPLFYEQKERVLVTVADIMAAAKGGGNLRLDKLGPFNFQLLQFLKEGARVKEGLARKKPKNKKLKELEVDMADLLDMGPKLGELLEQVNPKPVYATQTLRYVNGVLSGLITIWGLEEVLTKPSTFYASGALHLNKTRPHTDKGGQLTLFDLEPHEIDAITNKGQVAIEEVTANGIKRGLADLTGPEHRLLLALSQLLHELSQETFNPKSEDYYTGDGLHPVGGGQWPYIWVSPYDLALTCKGESRQRGAVGGNDVKAITETVEKLSKREFLLSFPIVTETTRNGRPTITTEEISTQAPIIQILRKTKKERDKETGQLVQDSTQIAIGLNPIYRHGITRYFVEWPSDTIARLEETKEGQRIPESLWVLLDYIQTRRSNTKTKEAEVTDTITAKTLFEKLQPKDMEQKKPKQAKQKTEKALEHCKRAGFLRDYQTGKTKSGEPTYILYIPKETPPFVWGSLQ
jgi:hypothetical protein